MAAVAAAAASRASRNAKNAINAKNRAILRDLPLPIKWCRVAVNVRKKDLIREVPEHKIKMGNQILKHFQQNKMILFLHECQMKIFQLNDLKFDMRHQNLKLKQFPNKISGAVLRDTKYANIIPLFRSPTITLLSKRSDNVNIKSLLKVLAAFPQATLVGGIIDNAILTRQEIHSYAKLPTLQQSREELVQMLSQPSSSLSRLLENNASNLSQTLALYVDKLMLKHSSKELVQMLSREREELVQILSHIMLQYVDQQSLQQSREERGEYVDQQSLQQSREERREYVDRQSLQQSREERGEYVEQLMLEQSSEELVQMSREREKLVQILSQPSSSLSRLLENIMLQYVDQQSPQQSREELVQMLSQPSSLLSRLLENIMQSKAKLS